MNLKSVIALEKSNESLCDLSNSLNLSRGKLKYLLFENVNNYIPVTETLKISSKDQLIKTLTDSFNPKARLRISTNLDIDISTNNLFVGEIITNNSILIKYQNKWFVNNSSTEKKFTNSSNTIENTGNIETQKSSVYSVEQLEKLRSELRSYISSGIVNGKLYPHNAMVFVYNGSLKSKTEIRELKGISKTEINRLQDANVLGTALPCNRYSVVELSKNQIEDIIEVYCPSKVVSAPQKTVEIDGDEVLNFKRTGIYRGKQYPKNTKLYNCEGIWRSMRELSDVLNISRHSVKAKCDNGEFGEPLVRN